MIKLRTNYLNINESMKIAKLIFIQGNDSYLLRVSFILWCTLKQIEIPAHFHQPTTIGAIGVQVQTTY